MPQLTTIQKVRAIAPHLATIKDPDLQVFIDDAVLEKADLNYPAQFEEKIERYLAAHLATLSNPRADSEQIDTLKKTYKIADSTDPKIQALQQTVYGIEALRIMKKSGGIPFVVIS